MGLRAGYKQTEVGVIPEDWGVVPLGDISTVTSGGTPSRTAKEYWNGDIPWITTTEIDFRVIHEAAQKITSEGLHHSAARLLPPDTLLLALYGQGKTRGKTAILGIEAATNQACAAIEVKNRDSFKFIFYFLVSHYKAIRKLSNNGNQENLNSTIVRSIPIPLPPTKAEQTAIAEALSDVDALLAELGRLIAKKRALKQAALHQLLTAKVRLPGFTGDWQVKRLGELMTICHGRSQHDVEVADGPYPILATGGQIGTASRALYSKPSVLIGRKGTINQPQYMDKPFWTVDTLFYSEIKANNHAKFLFYRFCLINWMQFNEASGVPSLNAKTIERIKILAPDPEEQTAIAAVLSDMDAEIAALERRLAKTRDLKQAMMQELLTGKTRLVPPQGAPHFADAGKMVTQKGKGS